MSTNTGNWQKIIPSVDDFKGAVKAAPLRNAMAIGDSRVIESEVNAMVTELRTNYEREIAALKEQVKILRNQLELREDAERARRKAEQDKVRKLSPMEMRQRLDEILEEFGCEPAKELVTMAMAKDQQGRFILSANDRGKILMFLNKFRMPELKAVETTGTIQHDHRVLVMKFGDKIENARDVTPVVGGEQLALNG